jgi:glycosyltransferase involved in cell wall biosynthesis
MRVFWVNTVAAMGGAERSLLDLVVPLAQLGHEIVVACPEGPLAEALTMAGVVVQPIREVRLRRPSLRHPGRAAGWFRLCAARWDLGRMIRGCNPDLVHANSLTAMLALGGLQTPPVFWHVRDLALSPKAARWAAGRARAIIAISPAVETHLRAVLPPCQHAKIHLISNGIALPDAATLPSRQEARRQLALPGPPVRLVGMLAHFVPWKRHDRLIAVAAQLADRHPEARFVLAGGDLFGEHAGYLRQLRAQIAAAGLGNRVIVSGATDQPLLLLRALDLLVHPADAEPFGRVICEAMAVGTPVVAIDRAGPRSILQHDVTGWLVDPEAPDALARAVDRLLGDSDLRDRLASRALIQVREDFDIRTTAARISERYFAKRVSRFQSRQM